MAEFAWNTKIQAYLAKIAGKQVTTLPTPSTMVQSLLKDIATKEAAEVKLPDAPTSDGTYTLKVTVASKKATYSWVEDASSDPEV